MLMLGAAVLVSCKHDDPLYPMSSQSMSFSAKDVLDTKALLTAESFLNTAGNEVHVVDFYHPAAAADGTWYEYANTTITSPGSAGPWTSSDKYYWTLSGTHKAIGWLEKDNASGVTSAAFFGSAPSYSDRKVTIPVKEITSASPQYDFLFSGTSVRNLPGTAANDYSPINLEMMHAFTAIGMGIRNKTKVDIVIKSIKIQGLKNRRSAVIDYTAAGNAYVDDPDVTYPSASATDAHLEYTGSRFVLKPGDENAVADILTSTTGGNNTRNYFIMWPQSADDLAIPDGHRYNVDPDTGEYIENNEDVLIVIEYEANGVLVKRAIAFEEGTSMEPGMRYHYDVSFHEKMVRLDVVVNPWIYNDGVIDFTDAISVLEGGQLSPTADSYTPDPSDARVLYIKNGMGVNFSFALDSPEGATWMVSLEGYANKFNVSPSSGTIDGGHSAFTVTPKQEQADADYHVWVRISVKKADGTVTNADVLQEVDGVYTPYKIIQQKN